MRLSTARVPRSSYRTPARSDRHRVGWVARYGGLCTGEECCDGLGKIAFVAAQDSTMIQRTLEGEAHIARPKRAFTGCKHGKCAVVSNLQCPHARKRAPTRAGERLFGAIGACGLVWPSCKNPGPLFGAGEKPRVHCRLRVSLSVGSGNNHALFVGRTR